MTRGQQADKFIPSLDGLRAVAVMVVFFGHAHWPFVDASVGVTIFFFLSGYLITTLLRMEWDQHGRISLRDFYLRRSLRILPPLYLVLIVIVVLDAVGALAGRLTLPGVLAAVFHGANYVQAFGYDDVLPRGSGIYWSVAVEEHFYLLFPFLYIGLRKLGASRRAQAAVLAGLCLAALVWRGVLVYVLDVSWDWIYYATDARADSILAGCLMAIAANPFLDRRPITQRWSMWAVLPVSLVLIFGMPYVHGPAGLVVGYTVQAVGLAGLMYTVVTFPRSWVGRFLNWWPVRWVGILSFTIYLTHRLFQIPLQETFELSRLPVVAISLALTIPTCLLLHFVVERPATRLRKRLSRVAGPRQPESSTEAEAAPANAARV